MWYLCQRCDIALYDIAEIRYEFSPLVCPEEYVIYEQLNGGNITRIHAIYRRYIVTDASCNHWILKPKIKYLWIFTFDNCLGQMTNSVFPFLFKF